MKLKPLLEKAIINLKHHQLAISFDRKTKKLNIINSQPHHAITISFDIDTKKIAIIGKSVREYISIDDADILAGMIFSEVCLGKTIELQSHADVVDNHKFLETCFNMENSDLPIIIAMVMESSQPK